VEHLARRLFLALTVLFCALGGGTSLANSGKGVVAPASIEALMSRFAASGNVRARFRETLHLSLLTAPIETEGMLYFAPPDRLARYTTRPGSSSVVINADRVAFSDETGYQMIDLGSSEVARHLVGNLVILLRGDLATLRARYSVSFGSDGQDWVLDLEPRSRIVRGIVEWVRVKGRIGLTEMETRQAGGDTTVTVFSDVETGLDFTPTELERIFSLEDPDDAP